MGQNSVAKSLIFPFCTGVWNCSGFLTFFFFPSVIIWKEVSWVERLLLQPLFFLFYIPMHYFIILISSHHRVRFFTPFFIASIFPSICVFGSTSSQIHWSSSTPWRVELSFLFVLLVLHHFFYFLHCLKCYTCFTVRIALEVTNDTHIPVLHCLSMSDAQSFPNTVGQQSFILLLL